MSDWDLRRPPAGQFDIPPPSRFDGATYPYPLPSPLPFPVAEADEDDGEARPAAGHQSPDEGERLDIGRPPWEIAADTERYGPAGERDPFAATEPQQTAAGEFYYPPRSFDPAGLRDTAVSMEEWTGPADRDGRRRWLFTAGIVAGTAALGAAALLLAGGHPGVQRGGASAAAAAPTTTASTATPMVMRQSPSPSSTAAAPLTLTQAMAVLARYTTVNNAANAQRSGNLLATVETGSSLAIDAGQYQTTQAAGTAPYPPFSPVQATYYLPAGEPATGPRWFVVQVANAFTSSPSTVTSDEYLLFTQSTPDGAWHNAIEPYLQSSAAAPQIKVGADGLATAVSPDATSLTVAPSQLPAATAASLDGTGSGQVSVADPGNLADRSEQRTWEHAAPNATVHDTHAAATGADGQAFALLTTDGGAIVFYTDAASLTATPPTGSALHLSVPGFYSSGQDLTQAGLSYLEQFAAYDPATGAGGAPRVVANYSAITGKN